EPGRLDEYQRIRRQLLVKRHHFLPIGVLKPHFPPALRRRLINHQQLKPTVKIATDYNSHLGLLCSEYCEVWSKPAYPLHGGRGYPITPINDEFSGPGLAVIRHGKVTVLWSSPPALASSQRFAGVAPFALWAKSARRAAEFRRADRPRQAMQARSPRAQHRHGSPGSPCRCEHKRGARRSRAGARTNQCSI